MEPELTSFHQEEWEGPQGMRGREKVIAEPYDPEETNLWLASLGLPLIEENETIVDWDRRVFGGLEAAKKALPEAIKLDLGENDG
jgi:hypothetical protein